MINTKVGQEIYSKSKYYNWFFKPDSLSPSIVNALRKSIKNGLIGPFEGFEIYKFNEPLLISVPPVVKESNYSLIEKLTIKLAQKRAEDIDDALIKELEEAKYDFRKT